MMVSESKRAARIDIYALYDRLLRRFRTKRMASFVETYGPEDGTTILDVGGTPANWNLAGLPSEITLLNQVGANRAGDGRYEIVEGDARKLPYPDGHFDIGYSNSVIEHVGTIEDQQDFAAEIRRVAAGVWVQTPAKGFWLEPHYLTPFIHWLPKGWRRAVARNFTVWGWITRPSRGQVEARVEEIRLLGYKEFQKLFPDCEIRRERFFGWTKSYVAVREGSS